ncbi:MAG: hypothetical protein KDN20_22190 [Verrucomicrobiae bacterium]|nr:hypothetical protein [Verrucomicrobiae bacterium]
MRYLPGVLLAFFLIVSSGRAEDVLHFKDGKVVRCEIIAITDNVLTYKTTINIGGGRTASAQPTISPDAVDFIEFGPLPGEQALLAQGEAASLDAIKTLWEEKSRHLHRPRSNAGNIGLLYGDRLLAEPESFQWDFALSVFDRLLERDWNPENQKAAKTGRLRALIQLGRLDQATAEARELAKSSEDPEMLIEARHALALADFEILKALEEENPKWKEDDIVRPERERLYHEVIDQFLWPFLFHGTEETLAARGLVAAAEVHLFAGLEAEARACLTDVLTLYPQSPAITEAQAMLAGIEKANPTVPDNDDGNEATPQN